MNAIDVLLLEDNECDTLLATNALGEGNIVKDGFDSLEILEKRGVFTNQLPKK
jgi:hypothetical protein